MPPTTFQLKSFGILHKGSIAIGAGVSNSQVGRGQRLQVALASRNDSDIDVDRVQVKLVELITCRADSQEVARKNVLILLKDVDLPALSKKAGFAKSQARNHRPSREWIEATNQQINRGLSSQENMLPLEIPAFALDSYNGKLVQISHYIKVTFYTKKTLTENPSAKLPIWIGNRMVSNMTAASTPSASFAQLVDQPPQYSFTEEPLYISLVPQQAGQHAVQQSQQYVPQLPSPSAPQEQAPQPIHQHPGIAEPSFDYSDNKVEEPEIDVQSEVPMAAAILLDGPHSSNNNIAHPSPSAPPAEGNSTAIDPRKPDYGATVY